MVDLHGKSESVCNFGETGVFSMLSEHVRWLKRGFVITLKIENVQGNRLHCDSVHDDYGDDK